MEKVTTLAEFKINMKQPLKHLFISFPKLLAPIAFPGSSTYLRRFIRNSRPLICKHQHCFYFLTTRAGCSSVTRFVNLVAIHPTLPFHSIPPPYAIDFVFPKGSSTCFQLNTQLLLLFAENHKPDWIIVYLPFYTLPQTGSFPFRVFLPFLFHLLTVPLLSDIHELHMCGVNHHNHIHLEQ